MVILEQTSVLSQGVHDISAGDSGNGRPPSIGDLLRSLRGGRTLRQVEADTGVSNSYLCNLESGLKRPGIRTLSKLSAYYQAPLQDLLQAAGLDPVTPVPESAGSVLDVQRSYEFVMADPDFRHLQKPQGTPSVDYQRFIVEMYQHYTGKRLL